MAYTLSKKISDISNIKVSVGRQLLEIITTGMYNDSKMIIREYIQNSVDALDEAILNNRIESEDAQIDIRIDGKYRNIIIDDNGIGVSNNGIEHTLCSIGVSNKNSTRQRGFRGIGRLGGLGYCKELQFTTRNSTDEDVAIITWDANRFYELVKDNRESSNLEDVIYKTVRIDFRPPNEDDLPHFFRVKLVDVLRFHKDDLMNIRELKKYLSQTAPVPYSHELFSFADKVESHVHNVSGYRSYRININDAQIFRPYTDRIPMREKRTDIIRDVELIEITGPDGETIGKGWYAKTNFLASLPLSVSMRGIRIRQGNIEVGGDSLLDKIYTEKRFSGWHIGEIHVCYHLKLNARRDDFEPTPESERLLEQLTVLGKHLSNLCRDSSKNRTEKAIVDNKITQIENELVYLPLFNKIDFDNKRISILKYLNEVESLKQIVDGNGVVLSKIKNIRNKLEEIKQNPLILEGSLDWRRWKSLQNNGLINKIFKAVVDNYEQCSSAGELLFQVIKPYLKDSVQKQFKADNV